MKILIRIQQLLVALWLGAAIFFSVGVAPAAFRVLPSGELAGAVVNQSLTLITVSGIIIGLLLFFLSFIPRKDSRKVWLWGERLFLLIFTGGCAAGQMIASFYLDGLRSRAGKPIQQLAVDDPIRVSFDLWHTYSVWALMTAMGAALIVYFVIAGSPKTEKKKKNNDMPEFDLPDELK